MIIYYLDSSLNYGGQEIKTLSEAAVLTARGHSITIVGRPKSKIVQHAKEMELKCRWLEMPNSLSPLAIWTLLRWIREDQVSILHSHSAKDAWISGIAARLSDPNFIVLVRTDTKSTNDALKFTSCDTIVA